MSRIFLLTMLISLLTAGTVFAADQATPADFLYPLDRTVENLRLDLIPSPNKAKQLKARFSAERIQEAGQLLQSGDGDKEDSRFCSDLEGAKHPVGWRLASQYELDYGTVMAWFCHGIDGGKDSYGFGEIMLVLETADQAGVPAGELLERRGDAGWGEIWQDLGLIGNAGEDEDGPGEGKGPPFEVPRGPKEGKGKGKGKPPDVPPGPPADRGRPDHAPEAPPVDPDESG